MLDYGKNYEKRVTAIPSPCQSQSLRGIKGMFFELKLRFSERDNDLLKYTKKEKTGCLYKLSLYVQN